MKKKNDNLLIHVEGEVFEEQSRHYSVSVLINIIMTVRDDISDAKSTMGV